jgi:hypothetical protein
MWHNVPVTDSNIDDDNNVTNNPYSTTAIVIPYDLCQSYAQVRIIWEDNEAIDTTEWSKPVGPLYNQFEYLKIGDPDEENCDDIDKETNPDEYKECKDKPHPIDYVPCKAS